MESLEWLPFFYPNNCYICRKTTNLKRCSRCQMISYCGQDHQKQHWYIHKDLCKIISTLMKERRVSHLFENLRGVDVETWNQERSLTIQFVELRFGRPLFLSEKQLFLFPRSCFVCYDSRQDLLKSCPGCPNASFCDKHKSSSLHDQDCLKIKDCQDVESRIEDYQLMTLSIAIQAVIKGTKYNESSQLPTSSKEYLDQVKVPVKLPQDLKLHLTWFFTKSLTFFHSLQKINYPSASELVIHVSDENVPYEITYYWEVLLHLLPKLKNLRIVLFGYDEDSTKQLDLCKKCCSRKKKVTIECLSVYYTQYITSGQHKKADFVAFYGWNPAEGEGLLWEMKLQMLNELTCPMIFTTKGKLGPLLSEGIRSILSNFQICYSGKNDFKPLRCARDWENGGICYLNEYLICVKPACVCYSERNVHLNKSLKKTMSGISAIAQLAESKSEPKRAEKLGCEAKVLENLKSDPEMTTHENLNSQRKANSADELLEGNRLLKDEILQLKNQLLQMKKENDGLKEENCLIQNRRRQIRRRENKQGSLI